MRTWTRWLAPTAAAALLLGGAMAAADEGPTPCAECEQGAMLGDIDQDRGRDRIHQDATEVLPDADQDRDRVRLHLQDGSCLDDPTEPLTGAGEAVTEQSGAMVQTRTQAREGDASQGTCACRSHEETNRNGGQADVPQQEQEQNGSGASDQGNNGG